MTQHLRATAQPSAELSALVGRQRPEGTRAVPAPPAAGSYVPWTRWGSLISVSFQLPFRDGQLIHLGLVGRDVTEEQAREAACCCADNVLAQLRNAADGDLGRIALIRLEGHVACVPEFDGLPRIIDAASERLIDTLGDRGLHARTLQGHQVTPLNASVMLGTWAHLVD